MDLEIKHGFHRSSDPSRRISLISLARAPSQVFWALPYLYPSLDVVGSFVPATAATVGLVDRLLVYNHTYPSGTGSPFPGRSSFQDDLLQISTLMRSATSTSLLLIDEFGRGTRAADGAGLLGAVVQALAATGSAPRTLVCTHFSELFDPRVLPPNPQIACYTMATMVREDDTGVVGGGTAVGATGLQGSTAGGGGADATDTGVFFRRSAPHPIITTTQTDLATTHDDVLARGDSSDDADDADDAEGNRCRHLHLYHRRYRRHERETGKDAASESARLVCLFQVTEGRPSRSFVLRVARACGVPSVVVNRAEAVLAALTPPTVPLTPFISRETRRRDALVNAGLAILRSAGMGRDRDQDQDPTMPRGDEGEDEDEQRVGVMDAVAKQLCALVGDKLPVDCAVGDEGVVQGERGVEEEEEEEGRGSVELVKEEEIEEVQGVGGSPSRVTGLTAATGSTYAALCRGA